MGDTISPAKTLVVRMDYEDMLFFVSTWAREGGAYREKGNDQEQ